MIIVGEAPSFTGQDRTPLSGPGGDRLAQAMGLRDHAELAERFTLLNVLDYFPGREKRGKGAAFPMEEARPEARRILAETDGPMVLLGQRVAAAFGMPSAPYLVWLTHQGRDVCVVPHPSGINRWWNDERNRRVAERFLAGLAQ